MCPMWRRARKPPQNRHPADRNTPVHQRDHAQSHGSPGGQLGRGGALRYTPGVQAEPFGFEPRFTFLRFRGFDATQNGLFRDGLQLRNPGFAVSYNLEPYGAEEIDVPRGPASFALW